MSPGPHLLQAPTTGSEPPRLGAAGSKAPVRALFRKNADRTDDPRHELLSGCAASVTSSAPAARSAPFIRAARSRWPAPSTPAATS